MAILTSCSLNLSTPNFNSNGNSSHVSKTSHVVWRKKEKPIKWQCVFGVACVMIGLECVNNFAIAGEFATNVASKGEAVAKWSDKRKCSPWQMNSLETIVPENLPRPSTHRRWESIGFDKDAPTVKYTNTNCFSM